jgi:hypothetical protein
MAEPERPIRINPVINGPISLSINLARISTRSLAPVIDAIIKTNCEAMTIPTNIARNEIMAMALMPIKIS